MAFLLLLLLPVCSFGYDVEQVPNVHLKDKRQFVSDPDNILSQSARDSINVMAMRLEMTTGIETAVVLLPTIGDADIFDFSHNLFRRWGIGKKNRDNGFLVVFVMDQHKVRFTTGYGIEGIIVDGTDVLAVYEAMQRAVEHARSGKGPVLLECDVYRYTGHYVGDPAKYMSVEYNTAAHQNDVIDKFKTYLLAEGVASQGELDAVEAAVEERMEKAYQFALDAPLPDPADVLKYNYACDNERSVAR